ncbi:MAG: hypothetical protein KKA90_02370 [Nanoarchaeota archaeon]|nr:hypothetical protein [Nanoarchaeota archaeon]
MNEHDDFGDPRPDLVRMAVDYAFELLGSRRFDPDYRAATVAGLWQDIRTFGDIQEMETYLKEAAETDPANASVYHAVSQLAACNGNSYDAFTQLDSFCAISDTTEFKSTVYRSLGLEPPVASPIQKIAGDDNMLNLRVLVERLVGPDNDIEELMLVLRNDPFLQPYITPSDHGYQLQAQDGEVLKYLVFKTLEQGVDDDTEDVSSDSD